MNCGAEGIKSILALLPVGMVADEVAPGEDPWDPVMVHMTVCKAHVRPVRTWLLTRMMPGDEPFVMATGYLMEHWGQVVEPMGLPVLAYVRTA